MNQIHRTVGGSPPPLIQPFDGTHDRRVRELWRQRFDPECESGHIEEWLTEGRIDADESPQGFVALDRGRVVGFGIAEVGGPEYIDGYVGVDLDADVSPWPQTGVLHLLVVDQDYEGRGIGTALVRRRLQWLAGTAAEGVIGVAWNRQGRPDSRPLFEKFGFEALATAESYYAKCEETRACPDCGGPCQCDATIYRRPLDGGES